MRAKLKEFFGAVETEYREAKRNYEASLVSAQEVAASAALSPSQSGDRYHSQSASELARQTFENAENLKKEIEEALNKEIDSVRPPCFVNLDRSEFYLVNYPVLISGFKIVSSKSPLGAKLLGRKLGDRVKEKEILEIG